MDIQMEIQALQGEIATLQSQCPHPTSTIMAYMWRVGSMFPARICDACNAKLTTITKEEEDKWWADWRKEHTPTVSSSCTFQTITTTNESPE
jgi:hypothetical protein